MIIASITRVEMDTIIPSRRVSHRGNTIDSNAHSTNGSYYYQNTNGSTYYNTGMLSALAHSLELS